MKKLKEDFGVDIYDALLTEMLIGYAFQFRTPCRHKKAKVSMFFKLN